MVHSDVQLMVKCPSIGCTVDGTLGYTKVVYSRWYSGICNQL